LKAHGDALHTVDIFSVSVTCFKSTKPSSYEAECQAALTINVRNTKSQTMSSKVADKRIEIE